MKVNPSLWYGTISLLFADRKYYKEGKLADDSTDYLGAIDFNWSYTYLNNTYIIDILNFNSTSAIIKKVSVLRIAV